MKIEKICLFYIHMRVNQKKIHREINTYLNENMIKKPLIKFDETTDDLNTLLGENILNIQDCECEEFMDDGENNNTEKTENEMNYVLISL